MSRTHHHSKRYWKGDKAYAYKTGGWLQREPKWWRKAFKHRPRRAALKRAIAACREDPMEAVFPLDKKPWIYYY